MMDLIVTLQQTLLSSHLFLHWLQETGQLTNILQQEQSSSECQLLHQIPCGSKIGFWSLDTQPKSNTFAAECDHKFENLPFWILFALIILGPVVTVLVPIFAGYLHLRLENKKKLNQAKKTCICLENTKNFAIGLKIWLWTPIIIQKTTYVFK